MSSIVSVRVFNGNVNNYVNNGKRTVHLKYDRFERMERVKAIEETPVINKCFIVDKNHPNGLEIHAISENGIIYIYNMKSKNLITALIARPYQVKRLYQYCNLVAPRKIIDKARKHQENNLNY